MEQYQDNYSIVKKVDIAQLSLSIFETVRKVERGDISLAADFQRKPKWSNEKKSRLIESIILDIPIQAIYLAETAENQYEIIDGQQRIRTIAEFIRNDLQLKHISLYQQKNAYFRDLSSTIQRKIEDFQLVIFVVKKNNDANVKFDIFERINSGASQLNSQELRNCIYRTKGMPFIKRLAQKECYKKVILDKKVNSNAMKDEELVLRFLAFYYRGYKDYTGNLKNYLNDTLEWYNSLCIDEMKFEYLFEQTMECIAYVFGEDAFVVRHTRRESRKLNVALFDILTYTFAHYIEQSNRDTIMIQAHRIRHTLNDLIINNRTFNDAIIGASTTTKAKTQDRFSIWEESMKRIIGGN